MLRTVSVLAALIGGCATTAPTTSKNDASTASVAETRTILGGSVTDSDGRPVAGAKVTAYGGLATRWRVGETTTDTNGHYCFDPFPGGAMFRNEGTGNWDYYVGLTIDHADFASADGNSWWDITCKSGQETRKDFRMQKAGAVEGRLLELNGTPMANVGMRFQSPSQKNVKFLRYATTRADGSFREIGLAPGEFVADINHHPYPITGRFRISPGQVTRIDLHAETK